MFVGITNTPRDYAWGSRGAISELLGLAPTDALEAELWLGSHPGSPSRVVGTDSTLDNVLDERVPFLLKVLAADSPLSLQAHPNAQQAREGFERENAAGIPIDSPERNYRDPFPKPELLFAVSEQFDVLCGFRRVSDIRSTLETLADAGPIRDLDSRLDDAGVRGVFEWLIARGPGVDELVSAVSIAADDPANDLATAVQLAKAYPGDPGIAISLLMHRLTLRAGECLYLPAGNVHAYLEGVGIELMTASDNVLRGGLTSKHVDIAELTSVIDFAPLDEPLLDALTVSANVEVFRPADAEFELAVVTGDGEVRLAGPAIMLCTAGAFDVAGAVSSVSITRGQAQFASADETILRVSGEGTLFVATGQ
jgi:mannose-6-phosphate isomerase